MSREHSTNRFVIILQGIILGAAIATIYTLFFTEPTYTTQSQLTVGGDGAAIVQSLDSQAIEQAALERMGASGEGSREWDYEASGQTVNIVTQSNDGLFSADFANTLADMTVYSIRNQGIEAQTSQTAAVPQNGDHPDLTKNLLMGSGGGLVLGLLASLFTGRPEKEEKKVARNNKDQKSSASKISLDENSGSSDDGAARDQKVSSETKTSESEDASSSPIKRVRKRQSNRVN